MANLRDHVLIYLNGERKIVRGKDVFLPLSNFLRYELRLTGTKVVCAEGDCAACTVMRSNPEPKAKGGFGAFQSVNSCIAPVGLFDGAHLVTVEGLQEGSAPSEVQKKMIECHGGQCGFCTPGFVMAITNLFEHCEKPDEKKTKNYLTGNLCRCTGYAPILKAAASVDPLKIVRLRDRYLKPATNRDLLNGAKSSFRVEDGERIFLGPRTLREAARMLASEKGTRILGSATDLGVQCNKERIRLDRVLTLHRIPELQELKSNRSEISVGGSVDLTRLEKLAESKIPAFGEFLRLFASLPIKNAATLCGNIANGSPIADTLPFLFLMEAKLEIVSLRGKRVVPITEFYKGYKKTDLRAGEIIARIRIPIPPEEARLKLYKVSQRRDLDISAVNAGFLILMNAKGTVQSIRIAYGGVAATTLRLPKTERFLLKKKPEASLLAEAGGILQSEITPLSDARGEAAFRRKVSERLFRKFFVDEGLSLP